MPLIDTAPLRAAIAAMAARVIVYLQSGAPLPKQADRIRCLFPLYRLLLKYERHNRAIVFKSAMLADVDWCRRVFMELGGWVAARRWERRWKNRHDTFKTVTHISPQSQQKSRQKRSGSAHKKTDSQGYFCWVRIERNATPNPRRPRDETMERASRTTRSSVPPIELWPHEITDALYRPKNKAELINVDDEADNSQPFHDQNQESPDYKRPDPPPVCLSSKLD